MSLAIQAGFRTFKQALADYGAATPRDGACKADAIGFLGTGRAAFLRENLDRHFTGSAFIVDAARGRALLMHHRKLDRWIQPGGHCDGIPDPFLTAWKEAYEETGLTEITPASSAILDLDVHAIPRFMDVPEHLHYDVRYLFLADSSAPLHGNSESKDLSWTPLGDVERLTDEPGLLAMRDKAAALL